MKSKLLLLALMVVLSIAVSPASAYLYWINGTTNRSDTNALLPSAYVYVGGNSTTSNATGWFALCCMENNTNGYNLTAQYNTTDSYTANTTRIVIDAANITNAYMTLTVKVPAISGVTESGVGKKAATVSWTSNVSNVGNKLTYSTDSNFASNSFDTAWLNSTTAPSFTLSNLRVYTKYYYRVSTGNIVNSNTTYTTTSDGDFTTAHGYVEEELPLEAIAKIVVKTPKHTPKPLIDLGAITGSGTKGASGKGIGLLIAIVIVGGIVAYFWSTGSKGKTKRKR